MDTNEINDTTVNPAPWTVDCWIYPTGSDGFRHIFTNGNVKPSFQGYITTTGGIAFYNGIKYICTAHSVTVPDTWYHCAWVFDGTNLCMYINGEVEGVFAMITSEPDVEMSMANVTVAYDPDTRYPVHVHDFAVTFGTARYTSAFTPPARSLSDIPRDSVSKTHDNETATSTVSNEPLPIPMLADCTYINADGEQMYCKHWKTVPNGPDIIRPTTGT
jgi:hypothetical protein